MEVHGGMYSRDAGQKHNVETLWNYAFMEMHVDEIGIIAGPFYFMACMNVQAKRKKTYLVPNLFFLSMLSSFLFFSIFSLSFSFFSITKNPSFLLFFPFDQYISFFFHYFI